MKLFLTPNGRIDQPTYWRAVGILFLASAAISVLGTFVHGFFGLFTFAVIWCWIAIHAKRFHDNGKSGAHMLWLILVAGVANSVLGNVLPALFGFDAAAYSQEISESMSSSPDFARMMELINDAQKATIVPNILTTLITTGILGGIMSLFKTDPNDNPYGPGPGGANDVFV